MTALNKINENCCLVCDGYTDNVKRIRFDTTSGKVLLCSVECFKTYMDVREIEKEKRQKKTKEKVKRI